MNGSEPIETPGPDHSSAGPDRRPRPGARGVMARVVLAASAGLLSYGRSASAQDSLYGGDATQGSGVTTQTSVVVIQPQPPPQPIHYDGPAVAILPDMMMLFAHPLPNSVAFGTRLRAQVMFNSRIGLSVGVWTPTMAPAIGITAGVGYRDFMLGNSAVLRVHPLEMSTHLYIQPSPFAMFQDIDIRTRFSIAPSASASFFRFTAGAGIPLFITYPFRNSGISRVGVYPGIMITLGVEFGVPFVTMPPPAPAQVQQVQASE